MFNDDQVVWDDAPPKQPANRHALLNAVRYVESRGNPNAVSPAGAVGPYQFMPKTAAAMGIKDPTNEEESRAGADRYLAQLEQQFGNTEDALLAYNWGPGNVAAYKKTGLGMRGQPIPKEAQEYVGKVMAAQGKTPQSQQFNDSAVQWDDAPVKPKISPEGTTRKAAEATFNEMPWHQQLLVGAGKSVADLGRAVGLMPEGDKQIDEAISGWGTAGNIGGEIALTAVPGARAYKTANALVKATKLAPKAARAIGMTAGGAAAGATSEAMMDRDPVTGALIGATLAPVANIIGKVGNAGLKQLQKFAHGPKGEAATQMRKTFGNRTQAAIAALRNADEIVPGAKPTAGVAATPNLPELAVIEQQARNSPQNRLFAERDAATRAAREAALDAVRLPGQRSPNPTTGAKGLSTVGELRQQSTGPLYEAAKRDLVPISQDMENLLYSPEIAPAMRRALNEFATARATARAAGTQLPAGGRTVKGRNFTHMSIDQLQRVEKQLAEAAKGGGSYEIEAARKEIKDLMRRSSDRFKQADELYREMSAPQNRADVTEELYNKMVNPANKLSQRATAYTEALRNEDALLKSAGVNKYASTVDQVFSPTAAEQAAGSTVPAEQLAALRNVGKSLEREATTDAMAKNSGILPDQVSDLEKASQIVPGLLMKTVTIMRSAAKSLGRRSEKEVAKIINTAAADPQKMADLLETLPSTERNEFINKVRALPWGKVPPGIAILGTPIAQKME